MLAVKIFQQKYLAALRTANYIDTETANIDKMNVLLDGTDVSMTRFIMLNQYLKDAFHINCFFVYLCR